MTMIRIALLVALATLASCNHVTHRASRPDIIKDAWRPLMESCRVTGVIEDMDPDDQVSCPRATFLKSLVNIRTLQKTAELLFEDLKTSQALADIKKRELQSKNDELQWKLDDPARSPYLWGTIGLVVGTVIGISIGYSK